MEHLIDKDALVAEIERLKTIYNDDENIHHIAKYNILVDILYFLDTLEVKETDLEKHLKEDIEDVFFDLNGVAVKGATHYLTVEDVKDIGKHFFELGLKAQHDNWKVENLWKLADGDDLPIIDREVIALLDNGKVVFAHRPPEYWDGKNIVTGKVTRNYPKTYDKGGWNIPDVKFWLDVELPKELNYEQTKKL